MLTVDDNLLGSQMAFLEPSLALTVERTLIPSPAFEPINDDTPPRILDGINVSPVERTLSRDLPSELMRGFILERDHSNVLPVLRHLEITQPSPSIRGLTQERSPIPVLYVEEGFLSRETCIV